AKFVHIIRDGRDVAMSIRKVRWVNGMLEAGQYWCDRVQAGRQAGATLAQDRYYEIHYESLVLQPEETLQRLCQWLELEYDPEMLQYYQQANRNISQEHRGLFELISKPVEPSRVQAWKRSLSAQDVADFESVAGDLLLKLGYELSGAKIPLQTQIIRQLREKVGPVSYKIRRSLKKF
ncbi:MAG: sulfotransferase, partial [Cyanobacteriota bacterium]|nr:sulfotransferase [Cyanobacteriota bacterium]